VEEVRLNVMSTRRHSPPQFSSGARNNGYVRKIPDSIFLQRLYRIKKNSTENKIIKNFLLMFLSESQCRRGESPKIHIVVLATQ
jgi:hypothetical protein